MAKKGKPYIFSTRKLDEFLSEKLSNAFHYEQNDFINVTLEYDAESFRYHFNNPDSQARVFTSKNAVKSLQELLKAHHIHIEPKKNFTVGVRATEMLSELGVKTHAGAGNAISLAQIIARNKDVKAVDFFCGTKSLDDLPEYLKNKKVNVRKEIVYRTELVHHAVDTQDFDGIIFLSPTAVYSFFKNNKLPAHVPAFCIGATTSEAVHLRCNNRRIEANEPSSASVVDKIIEYFKA